MGISDEKSKKVQVYLETIVECMPGNFYWKDKAGRYQGCNQQLIETLNFSSKEELIGKTDYDIWPEKAEELLAHDKRVMETGRAFRFTEEVILNGKKLFFAVVKIPWLSSEDGSVLGIIGNSLDITEVREAREQAQAANRAKTAFLANMSHDIRTPLAGIISMTEVMIDNPVLRTTENIRDTHQSSFNLLNMLNQILDFTKAESVDFRELQKPEVFPIREIVDGIQSLYKPSAKSKNLLLISEIFDNVPVFIKTKPTFIHKILVNLVGNALKFTDKGYVKVTVEFNEKDSRLSFAVRDTGRGIPEDKKESVFDWFEKLTPSYKGTEHGTGLGLATVKNAVEALEGNIKVTDNEGGGTIFTCNIPIEVMEHVSSDDEQYDADSLVDKGDLREVGEVNDTAEIKKREPQFLSSDEVISGKHLLLIEDNITAGKGASMLLKNAGFSIHWVETGEEGLSEILSGNYNIVISDIGLPDMNGDEVVLRAREAGVNLPIYALTGHANADKEALIESGFTEVMVKPLNIKLFLSLTRHHGYYEEEVRTENKKAIIDLSLSSEIGFDEDIAKEILAAFIEGLDGDRQELEQAMAEKNVTKLREILHRIRGGATYVGVPKFSAASKAVHEVLKEKAMAGEQIDFDKLFQPLFDAMRELKEEFKKLK